MLFKSSYFYDPNILSGSIATSGRWVLIFLQTRTLSYSIFKTFSLRYIHVFFFGYNECTYSDTLVHVHVFKDRTMLNAAKTCRFLVFSVKACIA